MAQTDGDELKRWLAEAPSALDDLDTRARIDHFGSVTHIGDAVASVAGLPRTRLGELLRFDDGTLGLALSIDQTSVECVLLSAGEKITAGSRVHGTGEVVRTPVGPELLGRVVDALSAPLDGGPPVRGVRRDPVERPAAGIIDRDAVSQSMMTGITVVDAMIPLGRGQRTLLMGDRQTGKTALAVDTVINQRDSDVICVYALIGQKASTVEQVIEAVRKHGAIDRCIFIVGEASATPAAQWLVPYAACTMAEYFRDIGQDALLVLDDLTKHAVAYRQLSLLLRRPPGREAYPGDIFYIHSRLLERGSKLSEASGGGSLTILPIIETQAGNLSAYIPTNLISITDGQIYFEPKLFYEGHKPAVNVGLSVSRVGSKTQAPIIRENSARLKLSYAQFTELEVFTRFGAMVDERTHARIEHGRRIRAILAQPRFAPRSLAVEAALLLALREELLDPLSLEDVEQVKSRITPWLSEHCQPVVAHLERDGALTDDDRGLLLDTLRALIASISDAASPPSEN